MTKKDIFNQTDKILDDARLKKLWSLNLLDTQAETSFDRMTELASEILGVPISLMTLVDANRGFFKSHYGLPEPIATERNVPLSYSFCKYLVQTEEVLLVEDARTDERVADNLAIQELGLIAYAGVPLRLSDGAVIGSFCAIDTKPHQWTDRDVKILKNLGKSIVTEIELRQELQARQEVEETLRTTEMKFRQIAESANDAIIVLDESAKILFCNDSSSTLFGYAIEELMGKSIDELTQESAKTSFHQLSFGLFTPQNQSNTWQAIRLQGRHKDGSDIPIEVSMSHFQNSDEQFFTLVIRDVTAQIIIENELRASEARYLQVLDAIPDFVFVKDPNLNLVWANKALQNYYRMSLQEMIGIADAQHVDEGLIQQYNEADVLVFNEGKIQIVPEEPIIRHDGTVRQFTTAKTPIFDEIGQVALLVGISRDITDSKNLERYLTEALEKNQELIELKSGFTSMVSHEFRTPLAVILSSTEIIMNYYDRLTEERRQEKLSTIKNQVKRLTHLMDSVLVVSKGDAQGLPFKPSLHDVHALAFSIVEEIRMGYDTSQVTIDYAHQGDSSNKYIDDNLFRHIFQNLLSNAVKYSRPDTIVQTRINCTDDHLTIVVVDQGIGIPKEKQENMFQTFHRADNVGTIQGTGLGLAIVKRAVETHGGTIHFNSVEDLGTMFVVKLPTTQLSTSEESF